MFESNKTIKLYNKNIAFKILQAALFGKRYLNYKKNIGMFLL